MTWLCDEEVSWEEIVERLKGEEIRVVATFLLTSKGMDGILKKACKGNINENIHTAIQAE